MMNKLQLDNWVYSIIDRVNSGQPNEDSRVELKREWIPVEKAARQLGGHANAARGENILWIVGVDEDNGVVGADKKELANWYPKIESQFDDRVAPYLLINQNISIEDKTVVALLFATDRAPYVVKNPKGGGDQLEVPWRVGNRTIPATRSHLIRLISPLEPLPSIQVIDGHLSFTVAPSSDFEKNGLDLFLNLLLYVSLKSDKKLVIPFHQCNVSYKLSKAPDLIQLDSLEIKPAEGYYWGLERISSNHFMIKTPYEVVISNSGMVRLTAKRKLSVKEEIEGLLDINPQNHDIEIIAKLLPVNNENPVSINVFLSYLECKTESELTPQGRVMYNKTQWGYKQ